MTVRTDDFAATISYLDRTDTVTLATALRAGGESRVPIWAVVVGDVPYVRSGTGPTGKWYRRVLRSGRGAFVHRGQRHEVRFEPATDPGLEDAIDRAYFQKYGNQGPTYSMTAPLARGTSLRVLPPHP